MGQHTAAYQAWTDGSYDQSDKGGTAYLLMNDNLLVKYEARFFAKATSPFHMEVYALLAAAKQAENMRLEECCFHSDSKLLTGGNIGPGKKISTFTISRLEVILTVTAIANRNYLQKSSKILL